MLDETTAEITGTPVSATRTEMPSWEIATDAEDPVVISFRTRT